MAFCPNCGSQASGRFCPNCGSDVAAATSGGGGTGSGYVPPGSPATGIQAPGLTENVASTLCYLFGFVTGIIFLVISPYNKNRTVRFHAFQSIFISIALFVVRILLGIFTDILYAANSYAMAGLVWQIYGILVFAGWLYLMYSTYNNRKIVLPVVGPLAAKQA